MTVLVDMTGQRVGRLTIMGRGRQGSDRPYWVCQCECGTSIEVQGRRLRGKRPTLSCGCLHREVTGDAHRTHGLTESDEYRIWTGIKTRCYNPNSRAYSYYGGRGIAMSPAWRDSFARFLADMGPRPSKKHSIERVDNDGPYSAENCCWATQSEQNRNQRKRGSCIN